MKRQPLLRRPRLTVSGVVALAPEVNQVRQADAAAVVREDADPTGVLRQMPSSRQQAHSMGTISIAHRS